MELFHSLQPPSEDRPSGAGGDRVCSGREMDTGLLRVVTRGEPALPGMGRTSHRPPVTHSSQMFGQVGTSPSYTGGNRGAERLGNTPEVMQLLNERTGAQTPVHLTPRSTLLNFSRFYISSNRCLYLGGKGRLFISSLLYKFAKFFGCITL